MKILLVITKAEIGGAQTFVLTLAQGLKQTGNEVAVAFGDGDYLPRQLAKNNIPFFRLKSLKRSHNPFLVFSFICELKKLIKKEKFSVVHLNSTNTLPGALAVRLVNKKIKTVFTVHGLSILDDNYEANKIVKLAFKTYFLFFLKFIDKIICVSAHNLNVVKKWGIEDKAQVIYNGLAIKPIDFLNRNSSRQKLSELIGRPISESDYLIGSIGRLAYQKNYQFIIENWLEIKKIKPTAKLIIIGEGPERNKYEGLIKQFNLGNDIYLPGESKDARSLLKGFNLFILPSIYEGLSISLIEALFSETAILASDVGGNKEIVGEDNCFKVNDQKDFLIKLNQNYITNLSLEQFTAETMIKKYLSVYEI